MMSWPLEGPEGPCQPPKRPWGLSRWRDPFACLCVSVQEAMGKVRIWGKLRDDLYLIPVKGRIDTVCVCKEVCTSSWSGAASSGAHTSRCQQLGRLGSRGSCWAD